MSSLGRKRARDLMEATAAYDLWLDEIDTVARQGIRREDPERAAYLGNIVQRAAARRRERPDEADATEADDA
ncbi:hypothetical protein GCM10010182_67810 [Actinomadura cremea]|nr:hypothetical protein GCM10010182_67810 [Actinomadura cremea]